ncbi:sensor histidine kinase [Streptomyces rubellomurinus]|uniref:sensor histidine kinase n=1 Tax=Streptomyces rubellomurinus (strain ATCC 31215) TaxID=359131 RepID=UPI0007C6A3E5|nr:histidine kinase [Streptomyces rubellomurinus]
MQTDPGPPDSRRRRTLCVVAGALVAAPAAFAQTASAWIVALAAAAALAVAVLRRPFGAGSAVRAAGLVAAVSLAVDAGYPGPRGVVLLWLPFEFAALLVLVARVVRLAPARQAALVGSALTLAVTVLPLRFALQPPGPALGPAVVGVATAVFPAVGAVGVGLYLRALDDRRARAVRRARREQRLEVARDLHDFVAHEVTGILLEVQAAQLGPYDEREVGELLVRLEAAGLRALDSMDHTLRTLREPGGGSGGSGDAPVDVQVDTQVDAPGDAPGVADAEPPPTRTRGLADLPELLERFLAAGPVDGGLDLAPGLAGTAPPAIEDAAYRIVLEALTNVRRHAPDTGRVAVEVVRAEGPALRVTVTDGGRRAGSGRLGGPGPRRDGGGGTGLAALGERVEALGGRLEAGPYGGGWGGGGEVRWRGGRGRGRSGRG